MSQTTFFLAGLARTSRRRRCWPLIVSVFLWLAAVPLAAQANQPDDGLSPEELVSEMSGGGLILYIRHAATDHSQSDRDLTDLRNCAMQRNLSEEGKAETRIMGQAIAAFGVPIGEVLSSPYCRAVDTAEIAFGRYEIVDDLRATFFTSEAETKRLNGALREMLSRTPEEGTNTAIVGHTANLEDVADIWPKPEGVTHVFRPLEDEGFEHLGRISPAEWAALLEAR